MEQILETTAKMISSRDATIEALQAEIRELQSAARVTDPKANNHKSEIFSEYQALAIQIMKFLEKQNWRITEIGGINSWSAHASDLTPLNRGKPSDVLTAVAEVFQANGYDLWSIYFKPPEGTPFLTTRFEVTAAAHWVNIKYSKSDLDSKSVKSMGEFTEWYMSYRQRVYREAGLEQ